MSTRRLSLLPALSVSAAGGILTTAIAFTGARFGGEWTDALFWTGLLTLFVPIAIVLALPRVSRGDRIGCVVLIVVGAYLVKVVHGPVEFVFVDEFSHWRTVADILTTGRLFTDNPLSIVSPHYPGLELVTAALARDTGLSIYAAGVIVVGVARLVLALALFLLIEELAGSARLAGLACVVYAGNPNFVFWHSQFAYESLSLPLAIFIIYLAVRRARALDLRRSFDIAILLAGFALVMTHHLTSYALLVLLAVWMLIAFIASRRGRRFLMPPTMPAFVIAAWTSVWLFVIAPMTFQYLVPVLANAFRAVVQFVSGSRPIKTFFQGDPTLVSPPWERFVAFGAVALVAGVLLASQLWFVRRGRTSARYRVNTLAWVFALGALLYFPIQSLRAIQGATEISNRAGALLFVPVGFICAIAIHYLWLTPRTRALRLAAFGAFATLVFMGGIIIGFPRWVRLPGAYLVSGDGRAIQPQSLSASAWFGGTFGADNRLIADQTNELIMGSYGGQNIRHGLSWVYFSPRLGHEEFDALAGSSVRFIVVDLRVTTMLPVVGYYYESGEPQAGRHTEPMALAQLERFDRSSTMTRVFDSGNIRIYAFNRDAAPPSLETQ